MMHLVLFLSTWAPSIGAITVLEDIFLRGVAMEIEIEEELLFVLLLQGLAKLFGVIDCRMKNFTRLQILPVKVTGCQRASVVAVDDSICVQHWYDIDFKMIS